MKLLYFKIHFNVLIPYFFPFFHMEEFLNIFRQRVENFTAPVIITTLRLLYQYYVNII